MTDLNKSYEELSRRKRKQVDSALARMRLRVEQGSGDYGVWYGELYLPAAKRGEDETQVVTVSIETRNNRVDDTEYVIGDYMIRTGERSLAAPLSYVFEIPFECQRALMREAKWMVVDQTWTAVCALVPQLTETLRPTRDEVDAQHYGAYAQRPGSKLPFRMM